MIWVRLYRHDQGTPRAVGFLDFFDRGEAQPRNDLAHRKVVGTVDGYDWRVEYA